MSCGRVGKMRNELSVGLAPGGSRGRLWGLSPSTVVCVCVVVGLAGVLHGLCVVCSDLVPPRSGADAHDGTIAV